MVPTYLLRLEILSFSYYALSPKSMIFADYRFSRLFNIMFSINVNETSKVKQPGFKSLWTTLLLWIYYIPNNIPFMIVLASRSVRNFFSLCLSFIKSINVPFFNHSIIRNLFFSVSIIYASLALKSLKLHRRFLLYFNG